MSARSAAAHRFVGGSLSAPGRFRGAQLLSARVRSGLAASVAVGRVHLVSEAAIATDGAEGTLAVRWLCGGGTANAVPAANYDLACQRCKYLEHLGAPVQTPAVYRCFDAQGVLLYIGSSSNPAQRMLGHRATTVWWADVASVKFDEYDTVAAARLAEAQAINRERPLHNKANNPLHLMPGGAA